MCTMTWLFQGDGYELFFNRDEAHTRQTAWPPEIRVADGVSYIAPIDADAGGTWMGVNQFGVTVCLLNGSGYEDPDRTDNVSRGFLVMRVMDCWDRVSIFRRLGEMDLTIYRPFTVAVLERGRQPATWAWFGKGTPRMDECVSCPLISSSFRLSEVARCRQQLFDGLRDKTVESLADFHRSHLPEAGPFSVCMHRQDAHSVSLSRVSLSDDQIAFRYAPGPPCETAFLTPVTLPLIASPSGTP